MHKNILFLVCLAILIAPLTRLSSGEAETFVKSKIEEFDSLRKKLAEKNTPAVQKEVKKQALKIAFDMVDVKELSRLALGNYYPKLRVKTRNTFNTLFHDLISERIAQANVPRNKKSLATKKVPIKILADSKKKDIVFKKKAYVVKTEVRRKKTIYEIDIYLFKKSDKFWLYDLHIDGASLLLDFKNQFARIIQKKGIKTLIQKLRKQINKLKKKG